MKIWITGRKGMLASHFNRLLVRRDLPFVSTGKEEVDITSESAVRSFVKDNQITHIINCAAYTQVDKAESEADAAFQINAKGPENLGKSGAKVIHFSTDYVFNGKNVVPYREEDVCAPLGVYGTTKREGEKKLLEVNPTKACIIRTSWLYGAPGKNFVDTMIRLMEERETLRVVQDQVGCPTYCQDLAEATLQMLDEAGIFHFANSNQTSWFEFSKEICKQAKEAGWSLKVNSIEPIQTHEYPTPAKRPAYSTLSTDKVAHLLGGKPRPWQDALKDYILLKRELSKK